MVGRPRREWAGLIDEWSYVLMVGLTLSMGGGLQSWFCSLRRRWETGWFVGWNE